MSHLAQTLPRGGSVGGVSNGALPALDPRTTAAFSATAKATTTKQGQQNPAANYASPAKRTNSGSNGSATKAALSGSGAGATALSPLGSSVPAAWRPYGVERIREREVTAAGRSRHANATRIAQELQDVRRLEREPQSSAPYPAGVQTIPPAAASGQTPFQPYAPLQRQQSGSRPNSASVTLPPVEGALPAPASASASVLRPVAGVDDPLMHAHVSTSATGTSFIYTSQRLADLAASKHARHFAALERYQDQRAALDRQLNAQVESLCEGLRIRCDQAEAPIRALLHEVMADDARLVAMDAEAIERARMDFDANYREKQADIDRTIAALEGVEASREKQAASALESLVSTWLEVAHALPAEIERTLADETTQLNVHLVRNRATAHELGAVLTAELVLKQQEVHAQTWAERYARWKELRHRFYVDQFLARFTWNELEHHEDEHHHEGEGAEEDEERERVYPFEYSLRKRRAFAEIQRHGKGFSDWATGVVLQVLRLTPRQEQEGLVQKVGDLAEQLQRGYAVYDARTDGLLRRVDAVEAEIHSRAQGMVRQLRADLLRTGARSEDQVDAMLAEQVWPLLSARSARESDLAERVARCMKHHDAAFLRAVDHFSTFFLGAARRWEEFQQSLAETDSAFHERLAERRDHFEAQISGLESQLEGAVALLAREPDLAALEARLGEVRALVGPEGALEEAYRLFYADSVALCKLHPQELSSVVESHRAGLARHFGMRTDQDLRRESLHLEAAQVAAAAGAAAAEEAADAALSKRDRAKRDKDKAVAKAVAEKAAEKAADDERKAKLARIKERAAAQAKEEMKAAALAKLQAQALAQGDGAGGETGEEGFSAPSSPSKRGGAGAGGFGFGSGSSPTKVARKSDEELLRELEASEAATAALASLERSISAARFYDYDAFASGLLADSTTVKLAVETPLHQLGLVEIQSGELEVAQEEQREQEDARTLVDPQQVRQYIVEPLRIREAEAAAAAAAEAALGRARSPSPGKRSRRIPSPSRAAAASASAAASAKAAESAEAGAASTLPYLALPAGLLQFHVFLDQQALLDRILSGEQKKQVRVSSAAATSAAPVFAAAGDATDRSSGSVGNDMQLSMGGAGGALETAGEAAEAAAAAALAEAQAAVAAASAAAASGPSAAAEPSASAKKPKSKSAKAAAAEEEAARIRAEEDRRAKTKADEEARLAALLASTAPPLDGQGFPTVHALAFPAELLQKRVELLREEYLLTLEHVARRAVAECVSHNDSLATDLLKELNLSLRRHAPRMNAIAVSTYEPRAKSLAGNIASYTRLVSRLNEGYGLASGRWEGLLLRGERELLLFSRKAREHMERLEALSADPQASLASLQGVNASMKVLRISLGRVMNTEVFQRFDRDTTEFRCGFEEQLRAWLAQAGSKLFGSHSLDEGPRARSQGRAKAGGAVVEELDAQGNVLGSSSGGSSNGAASECFHADELAHYAAMLSQFSEGHLHLLGEQTSKLQALQARYEAALALQEFGQAYTTHMQALSIQQGLGHANGAPKRGLTLGVRSEFQRSDAQRDFIEALLRELEAAKRGEIVVGGALAAAAAGKTPSSTAEEKEAHDPAADLAASFASLTVTPLSAPSAARAPNLALHLLHTIDQLRRALLARAQYLAALKPDLPAFVLRPQPIALDPQEAQTAAAGAAAAAAAAAAADAEEESLSSRGRSSSRGSKRTSGAFSTAAEPKSDLAKKPAAAGAAAAAGAPLKRAGTLASKGGRGSADDAASSAPSSDLSARPGPTFTDLIGCHVAQAKRHMSQLVLQYEAAYPGRQVPLATPPPPPAASQEAEEEKALGGGAKKKGGEDKKAAASRSKAKDGAKAGASGAGAASSSSGDASSEPLVPPAIEEHCAGEAARSRAHLDSAQKTLLAQVDRASALLAAVAPLVLRDVFERVVGGQLLSRLQRAETAFSAGHSQSQAAAARHRARLKPSLASRPDQAMLELRSSEDKRWSRSVAAIRAFRGEVLALLRENARDFTGQLLHSSSALLSLVDSLLLPLDLSNVTRDGGEVLQSARKSLDHLAKEARRLRLTKEAVAEQAGMGLDALGALVPKTDAAAAAAAATGAPKLRVGSASKKKSASALEAERVAAEAARAAGAELAAQLDPRFLRISWPGLRVAELELPEAEEERKAREEAEKARAAEAASTAREREAAASGSDSRKKKRVGKEKAAAAAASSSVAEEAGGDDHTAPDSPAGSPPGSATGSKRAISTAAGGRRNKKQQLADEAAAAAAATEAARSAAESAVQTPSISALNQPTQRAIIHSRNAIFAQYVALHQQQARALLDSTQIMLDAEQKARGEWERQVQLLINPEPLQF